MKKALQPKKLKPAPPSALVTDDVDFASLRRQIRNRVGQHALSMVDATITTVKDGQYAALKFLFETVGLFPAHVEDESQQDGLAPTLLRALGLPEIPAPDHTVTKDSTQS